MGEEGEEGGGRKRRERREGEEEEGGGKDTLDLTSHATAWQRLREPGKQRGDATPLPVSTLSRDPKDHTSMCLDPSRASKSS